MSSLPQSHAPWAATTVVPPLAADVVQVWLIDLAQPLAVVAALSVTLTSDEQARAARRIQRRNQWVTARGALRLLLAAHARQPAEALRFSDGPQGKPALVDHPALRFNLSHSGELALVAIAWQRELGVDIEQEQPRPGLLNVARRFFSASERAALAQIPPDQQAAAFFRCWARKEAYIKARGGGLSIPLRHFDVTLTPDEPARLLADRATPDALQRWTLAALPTPSGYAGALVAERPPIQLHTFHFQPPT